MFLVGWGGVGRNIGTFFLSLLLMEKVIASFGASREEMKANLEYYKRDEAEIDGFRRRFWFRNKYVNFHADLYGKDLYDFLDNYEIGDVFDIGDDED